MNSEEHLREYELLVTGTGESEALIVDAMFNRLSPDEVDQILGIVGVSSLPEALAVVREARSALASRVEISHRT